MFTISCASQPRERSLIGFASPERMTPKAVARPTRSTILYAIFPASRLGKMSTFARRLPVIHPLHAMLALDGARAGVPRAPLPPTHLVHCHGWRKKVTQRSVLSQALLVPPGPY